MYLSIIAVGKIGNSIEKELVNRYANRFNKVSRILGFSTLQIIEVDDIIWARVITYDGGFTILFQDSTQLSYINFDLKLSLQKYLCYLHRKNCSRQMERQ